MRTWVSGGRGSAALGRGIGVVLVVGLGQQAAGGGEGRGQAGGSVDHRGDGDLGPGAGARERGVAERANEGGGIGGRDDGFGRGQRRHGPPQVDRLARLLAGLPAPAGPLALALAAALGATAALAAALGAAALRAVALVLASLGHATPSVSSASGRMPRARCSWSASRSASELDLGSTRSAMWRLPATT